MPTEPRAGEIVEDQAGRVLDHAVGLHFAGRASDALRSIGQWFEAHPTSLCLAITSSLDYDGDGIHDMNWYVLTEDTEVDL